MEWRARLRGINTHRMGQRQPSMASEMRAAKLEIMQAEREADIERRRLDKEISVVYPMLQAAVKKGDRSSTQALSKAVARMKASRDEKTAQIAQFVTLRVCDLTSITDTNAKQKIMRGVGRIAKKQNKSMKIAKIESEQRDVMRSVQQLRTGQQRVTEMMDGIVAEDLSGAGESEFDEDEEAARLVEAIRDEFSLADAFSIPDAPKSNPSTAQDLQDRHPIVPRNDYRNPT
jgi:hypothetical protein